LVATSQANGNLVAGKNETSPIAFCVNTLNNQELVAFRLAGVVSHKTCCRGAVGVESLVIV
jgi:hypothetical protein